MVIPAGYGQVNLKFTGVGLPHGAEVTFGIHNATSLTPAAAAGAVLTAVGASNLLHTTHDSVTLSSAMVKLGPNATGPMAEVVSGIVGGAHGAAGPVNTAFLVTKATASGGRKQRGRFFLPGVPGEAIILGSAVSSAYLTALSSQLAAFLGDLATNDVPMVLLHGDSTAPTAVTSLLPQSTLATQRRRLRG